MPAAEEFNGHGYLFEFKVVEQIPEGRALQQIKDKRHAYYKYPGRGKAIHLIGVEFSSEHRQILAFNRIWAPPPELNELQELLEVHSSPASPAWIAWM